ncbi:hypothetical protein BGZ61DRAFT_488058 [Ilyonectria robusta]|uniref:uncharacterized protein n=1 Tax=Ilyonectria robusta TaxID=1079257 RepID=UPI001E8E8FCA|nr:uncharacterized protein BGZ61DRAFT_488058 [Ilyonectria robusta]KAH8648829.1 hypothetical protein BGZ61DRAFT_488058 [Ilyonectria robusta]
MSRSRTYRLMKEAYVPAYIFRQPKEGLFEREHDLLRPIPGYFCILHMARFKPMNLLTERHSRWRQDRSKKEPSPIPWCLRVRLSHGSLGLHKLSGQKDQRRSAIRDHLPGLDGQKERKVSTQTSQSSTMKDNESIDHALTETSPSQGPRTASSATSIISKDASEESTTKNSNAPTPAEQRTKEPTSDTKAPEKTTSKKNQAKTRT